MVMPEESQVGSVPAGSHAANALACDGHAASSALHSSTWVCVSGGSLGHGLEPTAGHAKEAALLLEQANAMRPTATCVAIFHTCIIVSVLSVFGI
jgi:prepilin-type processing-associated H-X9-DG protein